MRTPFSKHSTDLGHVTVDPFRIILKKHKQSVKQRPNRHSPVLVAKVLTETDKTGSGRIFKTIVFKLVESAGCNPQSCWSYSVDV